MTEPIQISFDVDCPVAHAFDDWTARISSWWPRSHTVSAEANADVVLERRVGGRIYERTSAGDEHDWGEVTAFEPPRRLSYVWHIRRDRADATEVAISFIAIDDRTTRVEIEHRGWERLGVEADAWRDRNYAAWATLLPRYRDALSADPGKVGGPQASV
ncbi:MAG: SRPBCC domain-containing protein [Solirubrobacteraceae bacterium]